MKDIKIVITGSGTREQLQEAISDIGDLILLSSDEELFNGIRIENSCLIGEASFIG